ncbi:hypothetical protein [Luteimonas aquatica]|uniref:hypothetical protein n=1 Tax=Luteimonas aquatica TaxID=450364 RepID=UPI001F57880C|nr:hypothetical protein [Luteimonas aquatica]
MSQVQVHKGTGEHDSVRIGLEPQDTLDGVRRRLEAEGFIGADQPAVKYRFINMRQLDFSADAKVVIDRSLEPQLPAMAVLGQGGQLILSNTAGKRPDLVGVGTDWFFDRFVAVRVSLNAQDASARRRNQEIGAFQPMMLTNVVPTNNTPGFWNNVCVCVENSVVEFEVRSWGAMGFEVQLSDELTGPFWQMWARFGEGDKNRYATMLARHFGADKTIQVSGADSMNIVDGSEVVRFQKITVRTRRVTAYTLGGKKYESHSLPQAPGAPRVSRASVALGAASASAGHDVRRALANARNPGDTTAVPGDAIKPGGITKGPDSDAPLGGGRVDGWEIDDWTQALGEIVIYFFVFKSLEAARKVIDGYNAPSPDAWR